MEHYGKNNVLLKLPFSEHQDRKQQTNKQIVCERGYTYVPP